MSDSDTDCTANPSEPCLRPTDWDSVSVTAIAELEMIKEDLEYFLIDKLEKFGRLLNLESSHNGRDNSSLSNEVGNLALVLSGEIEEYDSDDDDEPSFYPPISDVNEVYEYWDISSGSLVWAPISASASTEQEQDDAPRSKVDETLVNSLPHKASFHCLTLGVIPEEDEDEDDAVDKKAEASENDGEESNEPSLVAVPSPPTPVKGFAGALATNLLANALQTISDETSPESEGDDDNDASAASTADTCVGEGSSSGSSVTIYQQTTTSNSDMVKLVTDSPAETPVGGSMVSKTSNSLPFAGSTASNGTLPVVVVPTGAVELSDRQLTSQSSVADDGESQSQPRVTVSSEKLETNSAPGLLSSTCSRGTHTDQESSAAQLTTPKTRSCSMGKPQMGTSDSTEVVSDLVDSKSSLHTEDPDTGLDDEEVVFRSKSGELVHIVHLPCANIHPVTSEQTESKACEEGTSKEEGNAAEVMVSEVTNLDSNTLDFNQAEVAEVAALKATVDMSSQKMSSKGRGGPQNTSSGGKVASEIEQLLGEVVDLRGGDKAIQLPFKACEQNKTDREQNKNANADLEETSTEHSSGSVCDKKPVFDLLETAPATNQSNKTARTRSNPEPLHVKGPDRTKIKFEDLLPSASDGEAATVSSGQGLSPFPSRLCCKSGLCSACPQCKANKKSSVDIQNTVDTCNSLAKLNGGHVFPVLKTQKELTTGGGRSDTKEASMLVPASDMTHNSTTTHTIVGTTKDRQKRSRSVDKVDTAQHSKAKKMSAGRQAYSYPGVSGGATNMKNLESAADPETVKQTVHSDQSSKRSEVVVKGSSGPTKALKAPQGGSTKTPAASASKYKEAVLKAKSSLGGTVLPSKMKNFGKSAPSLGTKKEMKFSKEPNKSGGPSGSVRPVTASSDTNTKKMNSGFSKKTSEKQLRQEKCKAPLSEEIEAKQSKTCPNKNGQEMPRRHTQPESLPVRSPKKKYPPKSPFGAKQNVMHAQEQQPKLPNFPFTSDELDNDILAFIKASLAEKLHVTLPDRDDIKQPAVEKAKPGVPQAGESVVKLGTETWSYQAWGLAEQKVAEPGSISLPLIQAAGDGCDSAGGRKTSLVAVSRVEAKLHGSGSSPVTLSRPHTGRKAPKATRSLPTADWHIKSPTEPESQLDWAKVPGHNMQETDSSYMLRATQNFPKKPRPTSGASSAKCMTPDTLSSLQTLPPLARERDSAVIIKANHSTVGKGRKDGEISSKRKSMPVDIDFKPKEGVVAELGSAQGVAKMPNKSRSEMMSERLPPLTPSGVFSSLPKLPLTEDGMGYDAGAWIRANRDRVKQITSQNEGESPKQCLLAMAGGMQVCKSRKDEAIQKLTVTQDISWPISTKAAQSDSDAVHGPTLKSQEVANNGSCDDVKQMQEEPDVYSLAKIPLTSDGMGYDVSAWIRENAGRVKEMYAARRQANVRMTQSDVCSGGLPQIQTQGSKSSSQSLPLIQ